MLRDWLTVCLRGLIRHRLYTTINIMGLAVGLAAALLIGTYVRHELSYDSMYADGDRIYRITRIEHRSGQQPRPVGPVSYPVGELLQRERPEFEHLALISWFPVVLQHEGEPIREIMHIASPAFFQIFDLPFLKGDPVTALSEPYGLVLTEKMARKYFGDADPVGQSLSIARGESFRVTGVVADPPTNSSIQFDMVVSLATPFPEFEKPRTLWFNNWLNVFVRLHPGESANAVEAELGDMLQRHVPNYEPPGKASSTFTLHMQPLADFHLGPFPGLDYSGRRTLAAFAAVAGLILIVAGINFVNLSTARATLRAREVALRKTLGASRGGLVLRFMGEAVLLTALAGVVAMALAELLLPLLTDALNIRLEEDFASPLSQLLTLAGLVLVIGILSGIYPAFLLTRHNPADTMRGGSAPQGSGRLRTALVVGQFAVAIGLSTASLVILAQTRHAGSAQLGFDRENVVLWRGLNNPAVAGGWQVFRDRVTELPGVVSAAAVRWVPGDGSDSSIIVRHPNGSAELSLRMEAVDTTYLQTLGIPLVAGRGFEEGRSADILVDSKGPQKDAANVILSESAVRLLGWRSPEAALGGTVLVPEEGQNITLTVIGVIPDLQFYSARQPHAPTIFTVQKQGISTLAVRVRGGAAPEVHGLIDAVWRELFTDLPVNREFLDERIERIHRAELRQGIVLGAFAVLTVGIGCLGLFGLAAFTTERRSREIGIRKVMGARTADIVRLLVWQFSRPVAAACLIAWPIAWLGLEDWLSGFVNRIDLNPLFFLAVGIAAMLIA